MNCHSLHQFIGLLYNKREGHSYIYDSEGNSNTCTFRNITEKQLKVLLNRDPASSEQEASTYQEDPAQ